MSFKIVLGFFAAAALVSCAGVSAPPLSAVQGDIQRAVWAFQGVKHRDLLYISDVPYIDVYSYPDGGYVGQIQGSYPYGLCVNAGGDVYVVEEFSSPRITEYAHGASKPKRTLAYPGFVPTQCTVDPATGNLVAIAGAGAARTRSGSGHVIALYPQGRGRGRHLRVTGLDYLEYACYDDKSDLFIIGQLATKPALVEMPRGKKGFETIALDEEAQNRIRSAGAIQWSGNELAIANGTFYNDSKIDRLSIVGTKAHFRNETSLGSYGDVGPFWIEANRVVAPENAGAYIWRYPKGGKPLVTIGLSDGDGVVVSLARK